MSSTYSSNLRVELIGSGDQAGTWGSTTDGNFAYIFDAAIAGYQAVTVSSTAQALTYVNGPTSTPALNQSVYAMLKFNSAAAASAIYAPPVSKQYIIWNNSGYTITIYNSTVIGNTTAAGTGIAIANGDKIMVWSDGTNFYDTKAQNVTGTVAVANGGTGVTTAAAIASLVGNLLFPVGALYSSTSATNPGTSLGFGTWTAFGAGQMLIGVGTLSGQTFTGGATGGDFAPALLSHTHTGTTGIQSANHTHSVSGTTSGQSVSHTHGYFNMAGSNGRFNAGGGVGNNGGQNVVTDAASNDHTHTFSVTSSGMSVDHNHAFTTGATSSGSQTTGNLPPYIAVYMWQRTA
jgi:hypothetical protein